MLTVDELTVGCFLVEIDDDGVCEEVSSIIVDKTTGTALVSSSNLTYSE